MDDIKEKQTPRNSGRVLAGLILLVVGGILLLYQTDLFIIPGWIWSWPTWLIIGAIYMGQRHNYRNPIWLFMLFIAFLGILDYAFPGARIGNFIWPIMIISLGIWIIIKRNYQWNIRKEKEYNWKATNEWKDKSDWEQYKTQKEYTGQPAGESAGSTAEKENSTFTNNTFNRGSHYGDDYLDAVSVFSGVKKTILSKDFKGGEIVNVFGGTELDFSQADINGRIIIDVTQIFGGTKIVVPSNWQVVSDIASVFAGVDDKRIRMNPSGDPNKILVLKGTSIFAGVDIRSY